MKKVIVNLSLVVAILFVSCKSETKETATSSEKIEKTGIESSKDSAKNDVPGFSDKNVQEYVNAYEAYIEEYKKAVESKDMTAFASLGEKGQELGTKAQEVMGNLSGEDATKLSEYMQKKSEQLQELSQKMMQ